MAPIDVGIVCALRCEAAPIVEALSLEKDASTYGSDGVALAVSGVGAEAAGRAVRRLAEHGDNATSWLNIGSCGGRGEIGELVVAHRVVGGGNEVWYPQFPFPIAEPTAEVRTVNDVETTYRDSCVYEMEAAGFYAEALSHASLDRVHVLKVRVDGPDHSVERLNAQIIEDFMRAQMESIESWIRRLREVARSVRARRPDRAVMDDFLHRWHFTATQRIQLQRILERSHALGVDVPPADSMTSDSAREVLHSLLHGLGEEKTI